MPLPALPLAAKLAGLAGGAALFPDFAKSSLYHATDFLGLAEPPQEVQRWRGQNPKSDILSSFLGVGGPYLGAYKAFDKSNAAVRAVRSALPAGKGPVTRAMWDETARAVPTELAVLGSNVALGQSGIGGTTYEAGDLAFGGALGLAFGPATGAAQGFFRQKARLRPGSFGKVKVEEPLQLQLRSINQQLLKATDKDQAARLSEIENKLREAVRTQTSSKLFDPESLLYKRKRGQIFGASSKSSALNKLFSAGHLLRGDYRQRLGLPDKFEYYSQFPRFLSAQNGDLAEKFFSGASQFDDTFVKHLPEESLYILGKKTDKGWFITKTDNPQFFTPKATQFEALVDNYSDWVAHERSVRGVSRYLDNAANIWSRFAFGEQLIKKRRTLGRIAGKLVKPYEHQLLDNTYGRAALQVIRSTYDVAQERARKLVYGARTIKQNDLGRLVVGMFKDPSEGGYKDIIDRMNDDEVSQVLSLVSHNVPLKEVTALYQKGDIGRAPFELMRAMMANSQQYLKEVTELQGLTGFRGFVERENHYGFSRIWEGDHRVFIKNREGALVIATGGKTPREARDRAEAVLQASRDAGEPGWTASDVVLRDTTDEGILRSYRTNAPDKDRVLARAAYNRAIQNLSLPDILKTRSGVGGFQLQTTKKEFLDSLIRQETTKQKFLASMSIRHELGRHLDQIREFSDISDFGIILKRLSQHEGKPGAITKSMNDAIDRTPVSNLLGKGGATKIAATLNKFMLHLELGMGNVAFPLLNMLTVINTSLPHAAFVLDTPTASTLPFYGHTVIPVQGVGLKTASFLDPLRVMKESVKLIARPTDDFLAVATRAANDGTVDPRFIESHVGEHAQAFQTALKGADNPKNWASIIAGVARLTMEAPERFSRLNALSMGHIIAKDFKGIVDPDEAYSFAKSFTDATMFRYATPDRPTLISSPVGSVMGLFKNWMTNYMMWMLEHTKEGVRHGNWAPLMWQMAGTGVTGGIGAWPFMSMAENYARFTTDKGAGELSREWFGDGLGDALYYGLPGVLGFSLIAQSSMPFHDPLRDAEFMMMPVHTERAKTILQALGKTWDRAVLLGDINPLGTEIQRGMWARAVAPKIVYKTMEGFNDGLNFGEGQVKSAKKGYPTLLNATFMERFAHSFSMTPIRLQESFERAGYLWSDQHARRNEVSILGEEMAIAELRGDLKTVQEVYTRASLQGIDIDSVIRSSKARLVKFKEGALNHL